MKGEEERGWREEARESRGGEREREGWSGVRGEMKNDRVYSCCLVLMK